MIFFERDKTIFLHFSEFGAHRGALDGQIVRKFLAVKRNVKVVRPALSSLFGEIREQFRACCATRKVLHFFCQRAVPLRAQSIKILDQLDSKRRAPRFFFVCAGSSALPAMNAVGVELQDPADIKEENIARLARDDVI